MTDVDAGCELLTDARDDCPIEWRGGELLLIAGSAARLRGLRDFLRREQVENLDVPRGNVGIPSGNTATRHDDEPVRIDAIVIGKPADKRHPVERFVSDFGQPGPDDNWS